MTAGFSIDRMRLEMAKTIQAPTAPSPPSRLVGAPLRRRRRDLGTQHPTPPSASSAATERSSTGPCSDGPAKAARGPALRPPAMPVASEPSASQPANPLALKPPPGPAGRSTRAGSHTGGATSGCLHVALGNRHSAAEAAHRRESARKAARRFWESPGVYGESVSTYGAGRGEAVERYRGRPGAPLTAGRLPYRRISCGLQDVDKQRGEGLRARSPAWRARRDRIIQTRGVGPGRHPAGKATVDGLGRRPFKYGAAMSERLGEGRLSGGRGRVGRSPESEWRHSADPGRSTCRCGSGAGSARPCCEGRAPRCASGDTVESRHTHLPLAAVPAHPSALAPVDTSCEHGLVQQPAHRKATNGATRIVSNNAPPE
eukprot:scaffold23961_cov131-Isochrysis_galbana.AAC.14